MDSNQGISLSQPNFDQRRQGLPWVGTLFIFLIMMTYIPWISMYLPTLLMGPEIIVS